METVRTKTSASARTRSVAFVGLAIAIIAVSAWVTVPLGPIPFTLQMFAVTFAVVVLSPKEAIASIAGYLLLGAVGVPVFSGMRGGIGVLAGPTAFCGAICSVWPLRRCSCTSCVRASVWPGARALRS